MGEHGETLPPSPKGEGSSGVRALVAPRFLAPSDLEAVLGSRDDDSWGTRDGNNKPGTCTCVIVHREVLQDVQAKDCGRVRAFCLRPQFLANQKPLTCSKGL